MQKPIDEVLISTLLGTVCAAGRARGSLVELALSTGAGVGDEAGGDTRAGDLRVGDVFLGRVHRRVPAMGGAFVDIGQGRHGLLMTADAPDGRLPSDGETVAVQVLRVAEGDKGPKLSGRLAEDRARVLALAVGAGSAPRRLSRGPDAIEALLGRAEAGGSLRRVLVDDPALLVRLRTTLPALAPRLQSWLGPALLFEVEGVSEAIEAALSPRVPLPGGGRLIIEETAALVAIDVDLGSETGPSARTAALACNLQAAAAIGRETRLRDLAGRIAVDFVPVRRPAERAQVLAALQAALDDGERALRIGGWTRMGLVELIREKRGPALAARLLAVCPACEGRGRVHAPHRQAAGGLAANSHGGTMSGGGETGNSAGRTSRPCPICGRPADSRLRPFCSRRCADVDLHRWLSESYRIPVVDDDANDAGTDDLDPQPDG